MTSGLLPRQKCASHGSSRAVQLCAAQWGQRTAFSLIGNRGEASDGTLQVSGEMEMRRCGVEERQRCGMEERQQYGVEQQRNSVGEVATAAHRSFLTGDGGLRF
ncbi:hypothetical protein AAHE18_18G133000 [Arachis hypogaea]